VSVTVHTVEWWEETRETVPVQGDATGTRSRVTGRKKMSCKVQLELDVAYALGKLGSRAANSKGGQSCDGPVTVRRLSAPVEVERHVYPCA
jgi:hypothetical protein